MTQYKKGVAIEALLKKRAWNDGGWAVRAPLSAKAPYPKEPLIKSPEQESININITQPHVDLGFATHNSATDLIFYNPVRNPESIMVSEIKSVRQHAKQPQGKRVARFYLLEKLTSAKHPHHGDIIKSGFAMELEKAMLIAQRMNYMFDQGTSKVRARAVLIVYFVGRDIKKKENKEMYFDIHNLLKERNPNENALKVERDIDGNFSYSWYEAKIGIK